MTRYLALVQTACRQTTDVLVLYTNISTRAAYVSVYARGNTPCDCHEKPAGRREVTSSGGSSRNAPMFAIAHAVNQSRPRQTSAPRMYPISTGNEQVKQPVDVGTVNGPEIKRRATDRSTTTVSGKRLAPTNTDETVERSLSMSRDTTAGIDRTLPNGERRTGMGTEREQECALKRMSSGRYIGYGRLLIE